MRHLARFTAIIGYVIVTAISVTVSAHAGGPSVIVTPETLMLCPGGSDGDQGRALVVVQNSDQDIISNACLTAFANGSINAPALPSTLVLNDPFSKSCAETGGLWVQRIEKNAGFSALVNVGLNRYPLTDAELHFRVDYQIGGLPKTSGGDVPMATVVSKALTVKAPEIPDADAFKVEILKGSENVLHENGVGGVAVKITNATSDTIILEKLTASNPSSTHVAQIEKTPLPLSSHSALVIEYEITADKKVFPGQYTGLIDVEAKTLCSNVTLHRVASYNVTLSVFGQSELMPAALGVPSLLLLPGFLVLTLCMLLWRFKGIRASLLTKNETGKDLFFVSGADPEFWLISVTISLITFAFTHLPGFGYQHPYSLTDIGVLWGLSILFGLILYFFILFCLSRPRELTPTDDVFAAIGRLKARGFKFEDCKRVTITKGNALYNGFRLWDEGDKAWVIPQIKCVAITQPQSGVQADGLYKLDPAGKRDIASLLHALKKAKQNNFAEVKWLCYAGFCGPTLVDAADIEYSTVDFDLVVDHNPSAVR